jgi:curved DNA-binding protein CbpA
MCCVQDAYDTLSDQELRSLYDNRLERKVVANTEGSMYGYPISSQQGYDSRKPRPERVDVDTLGGRNMPLSGQALSALAFDLFVLCICIGVIVFVAFFKKAAST